MFVVGGEVADRLVQANRMVFRSYSHSFGFQQGWVGDGLQVRPLTLDVTEGLDPRLILRGMRAAVVLGDRDQRRKARASRAVIGGPLSETASRIGRRGSSVSRSGRSAVSRSSRPSTSSACSKITCTWVAVSSTETSVSIHLRDTISTIAKQTRRDRVKCVASYADVGIYTSVTHNWLGAVAVKLRLTR